MRQLDDSAVASEIAAVFYRLCVTSAKSHAVSSVDSLLCFGAMCVPALV